MDFSGENTCVQSVLPEYAWSELENFAIHLRFLIPWNITNSAQSEAIKLHNMLINNQALKAYRYQNILNFAILYKWLNEIKL